MLRRLIPQEYNFFESFDEAASHAVSAARLLLKLTEHYADADPIARELNGVEHACDEVAHRTMERLNKSFITPLDREDIHVMILRIDDVVDLTNAGAPGGAFANMCFPPSVATNFPDLGAYGGPDACNWLDIVPVLLPTVTSFSASTTSYWLSWGAVPRSSYQIQYSLTGPGSNEWSDLPNGQVLAADKPTQFPVWAYPSTNSKAFFRIQSLGRNPGN